MKRRTGQKLCRASIYVIAPRVRLGLGGSSLQTPPTGQTSHSGAEASDTRGARESEKQQENVVHFRSTSGAY